MFVIFFRTLSYWDESNECKLFVRREFRLHSNVNAKLRLRLVVIFSLIPEELKAV